MAAARRAAEEGSEIIAAFETIFHMTGDYLASMPAAHRTAQVQHGAKLWTARRGIRRSLEHAWEHLVEISERVGVPIA